MRLLNILLPQNTGFREHKMFWKEVAAWTNAVRAIISKFSPTFQPHFRVGMPEDMGTCHHLTRLSTRMQKKKFHYFNILIHFLYCGILVIWNNLGPCPDSIPYEVFNCSVLVEEGRRRHQNRGATVFICETNTRRVSNSDGPMIVLCRINIHLIPKKKWIVVSKTR